MHWFADAANDVLVHFEWASLQFRLAIPVRFNLAINSFMFPVNKSDLVAGPNTITLWSDQSMVVANTNIVLAGAGGVVARGRPRLFALTRRQRQRVSDAAWMVT